MNVKDMAYNRGYVDGELSATRLHNPMHKNWKRNKRGRVEHHNSAYLKGYLEGFKSNSQGLAPLCLQN